MGGEQWNLGFITALMAGEGQQGMQASTPSRDGRLAGILKVSVPHVMVKGSRRGGEWGTGPTT